MALFEVTILDRDQYQNGKKLYLKHDTVTGMGPVEMKADDITIIGVTKMIPGTMIWLTGGQKQLVQENIEDIANRIKEAIREENTRYHVNLPGASGSTNIDSGHIYNNKLSY